MTNMPIEYLNALANQFVLIAVFLGGFSATLLGTIISSDHDTKFSKAIIISSSFAALSFVMSVMAMTGLLLQTAEGYPLEILQDKLNQLRLVGAIAFFLGMIGFMISIGLSGWLKSKTLGIITSIFALIAFIIMLIIS